MSTGTRIHFEPTTIVSLHWVESTLGNTGRRIRPILFGHIVNTSSPNDTCRVVSFARNSIFAFIRLESNESAGVLYRIDILRAVDPQTKSFVRVPFVDPGGEKLLSQSGERKLNQILDIVDHMKAIDIDPADLPAQYWHHVHNRLSVNERFRTWTRARHQTWLKHRKVTL